MRAIGDVAECSAVRGSLRRSGPTTGRDLPWCTGEGRHDVKTLTVSVRPERYLGPVGRKLGELILALMVGGAIQRFGGSDLLHPDIEVPVLIRMIREGYSRQETSPENPPGWSER